MITNFPKQRVILYNRKPKGHNPELKDLFIYHQARMVTEGSISREVRCPAMILLYKGMVPVARDVALSTEYMLICTKPSLQCSAPYKLMPVVITPGRWRQEDQKFKVISSYKASLWASWAT